MPFKASTIRRVIRKAQRLVRRVEEDFSLYDQDDFDELHNDILGYVRKETEGLYKEFVEEELNKRLPEGEDAPAIFEAMKDRSLTQWEVSLSKAFATARDSATAFRKSIFTKVGRELNRRQLKNLVAKRNTGWFTTGEPKAIDVALATGRTVAAPVGYVVYDDYNVALRAANSQGFDVYVVEKPDKDQVGLSQPGRKHTYTVLAGSLQLLGKRLRRQQASDSPRRLFGLIRARSDFRGRWVQGFVSYLSMLFKTIPRNLERSLSEFMIRFYEEQELFWIVGGVIDNSAKTCIWCNNKVLNKDAYDFVTGSPRLKVRLYHPRCRHSTRPVPRGFNGKIYGLADVERAVRSGALDTR